MIIPDFEKLIQETEDNFSPQEEKLRNLIGIVIYLCNYNESSIESGTLFDLCVSDIVYSDLVKAYATKYGSPPLINSTKNKIAQWVCNYDTRSMRDIAAAMIGEAATTRPSNDFLRVT